MLIIASLYVEEDLSESDPLMTLELYDQQLKGTNNKITIILSQESRQYECQVIYQTPGTECFIRFQNKEKWV